MMERTDIHESLAELLRYPDARYARRLERCCSLLQLEEPDLARQLRAVEESFSALSLDQIEEQFTRTFDLNPVCSLEVGWHLFGENYDRGALMARIRRELARSGVKENGELPDHLTQVMPLLARMQSDEAEDFYAACVAPALAKMQGAFAKSKEDPFGVILRVICRWLHQRHGALLSAQPPVPVLLPILQEVAHD
jgi:nitrate reductase molybdenum cofactor assembly chaperone NarJ/NarW